MPSLCIPSQEQQACLAMGEANGASQEARTYENARKSLYKVNLSGKFLIFSVFVSCLVALGVGRAARMYLLVVPEGQCNAPIVDPLPSLVVKNGKNIPQARYSSKNFDTSMSASSSSFLTASRDETAEDVTLLEITTETTEALQEPSAEHLMVDIKHVDAAFLNSEGRLANAIIQVMNEAQLTLLSYHCHGLTPMGVSCVGVLKQNYISFHTWPEEGVITLDLCVGDAKSLLPVLPILQRAFGVPRANGEKPEMRWTHKIRGFPAEDKHETLPGQRQRWNIS